MNHRLRNAMKQPRQVAPLELCSLGDASSLLNELHATVKLNILREPAKFRARLASIRVDESRYTLVSYGTEVRLDCEYDTPSQSTILCLRGSCVIEVDGNFRRLNVGDGVIGRARHVISGEFSHDCERLVVRTPCDSQTRTMVEDLKFGRTRGQAFIDLIQAFSGSPALLACVSEDPVATRSFAELGKQVLGAIPMSPSSKSTFHPEPVPRAVLLSERLIRQRLGEPLTLTDLATAANVSERSLQAQFQRHRRCTPMQYLRDVRLDMTRALLEDKVDVTVAEVATRYGFTHLARFASTYRLRFGELPSATRARVRRAAHQ